MMLHIQTVMVRIGRPSLPQKNPAKHRATKNDVVDANIASTCLSQIVSHSSLIQNLNVVYCNDCFVG